MAAPEPDRNGQGMESITMRTSHTRRITLLLGGVAVVGVTALSGCSPSGEKPGKTTEPSQTAPSPSGTGPSPTEKAPTLTPGGPNSFTPGIKAPPAPTALPGNVITGN